MEKFISDKTDRFITLGSGVVRAPGIHMTNMIRRTIIKMGTAKTAEGWDMDIASEVGFLWEDIWSRVFADRLVVRLKEQSLDGIMCSPDGVEPDPGWEDDDGNWVAEPNPRKIILREYKCTWRSSRRDPSEDFYWMSQLKGYCRVMDTDTAIMSILYLVGDYRGSGPIYREARFTFDQMEIDQNWENIKREAAQYMEELNGK